MKNEKTNNKNCHSFEWFSQFIFVSLSLSLSFALVLHEVMSLFVRECNDESKLGIDTIVSASTDKTARIWKWLLFVQDLRIESFLLLLLTYFSWMTMFLNGRVNGDLICANVLRGHTGQIYCLQFDPVNRYSKKNKLLYSIITNILFQNDFWECCWCLSTHQSDCNWC
jgi:WD40 repeat protein